MPRYDYVCPDCKHEFEVKQSFSSDPVAPCPNCQGSARRVIHSVPIVFKGSGFYVNDYGKGKGSGASSESKRSKDSEDAPKKSDDSPASKSESESKVESKTGSGKDEGS